MKSKPLSYLPNSLRMALLIALLVGLLIAALAWIQVEQDRSADLEEMDRRAYVIAHQMVYSIRTALDPVLQACGGVWVAHGSSKADRRMVDTKGRLAVPPDDPTHTLRRVWLSREEEQGYYYGFANEDLWPLCHLAHERPIFRAGDWEHYVRPNRRFAEAALEEAGSDPAVVLVQDYQMALVPRFLIGHHEGATVHAFLSMAEIGIVSSLHNGMNLVAKEFVAAEPNLEGILILSEFAGAARELSDALIINPYDTEQFAEAIRRALEMAPEEQRERMRRMLRQIEENNIYRWAANFLANLTAVPILAASPQETV